jgi:NAD(P)-dependent dehydrogenase (short-subunit alcohol dehydrogenase family)
MVAYSASKAAVIALTKSAAKDLAASSIRGNSISPAFVGPGAMWDRQVELQANTPSQYFSDDPSDVAAQMIGSVPMRRYGYDRLSLLCRVIDDEIRNGRRSGAIEPDPAVTIPAYRGPHALRAAY